MTTDHPPAITVTRQFAASADRVFDAWLDPKIAGRWLFATASGRMVRVEIDARVGGSFTFTDRRADGDVDHVGEYAEIDRPRRLTFTFAVPKYSQQLSKVTVDLRRLPDGCELTLTHQDVPGDAADRARQGWKNILDSLDGVLNSPAGSVTAPS